MYQKLLRRFAGIALALTLLTQLLPPPTASAQIMSESDNGIVVGQTKLYDERTLATMLQTAEESLARLQFIDQGAPAAAIGRLQGARLSQSSFGFSLTTLPIPGVTSETLSSDVKETQAGTTNQTKDTVTDSDKETTTRAAASPNVPATPAFTSAFPMQATTGVSAQDILAEQVALNFQVMNLRLLLDRALSDRITTRPSALSASKDVMTRPQAVVGFQISVEPRDRYKNAVAEVEVTVTTDPSNTGNLEKRETYRQTRLTKLNTSGGAQRSMDAPTEAPSIVSLLPASKTYNVATISKSAKSFGFGAIVNVFNIGVSGSKNNESMYLVKDTDTISFQRIRPHGGPPVAFDQSATFGWQFRPVLGRKSVEPGTRQVFALLALPVSTLEDFVGKVTVHTHWRKYDAAKGTVANEPIEGSCNDQTLLDLSVLDTVKMETALEPKVTHVSWGDAGGGSVAVQVEGENFLPGTNIIAGDTLLGKNDLIFEGENRMIFRAPLQKLTLNEPLIIGRFGRKKLELPAAAALGVAPTLGFHIYDSFTVPVDAQNTRVVVDLINYNQTGKPIILTPLVAQVGGKAYGLSDSPVVLDADASVKPLPANATRYSFVVPAQALRDARKITIMELFKGNRYVAESVLDTADMSVASGAAYLGPGPIPGPNSTTANLAVTGSNFIPGKTAVLVGNTLFGSGSNPSRPLTVDTPSLIIVSPTAAELRGVKQLVVRQGNGQTFTVPVPKLPQAAATVAEPKPTKIPTLSVADSLAIRVEGENLGSIQEIQFEKVKLDFSAAGDGKSMMLSVPVEVTRTPGQKQLTLILTDGTLVTGDWKLFVAK